MVTLPCSSSREATSSSAWSAASTLAQAGGLEPRRADADAEPFIDQAGPAPCARVRSGLAADKGHRRRQEDAAIALDCLAEQLALLGGDAAALAPAVTGFYAVFDGHSGASAAAFAAERILGDVLRSAAFPHDAPGALSQAFMEIDRDYGAAVTSRAAGTAAAAGDDSSGAGTTALAALIWGEQLFVANAGDSRAVLSRRGRAIELTRDHKPCDPAELARIEACGGYVCDDGRLCGELAVARAIGDYHLPGLKTPPAAGDEGPAGPLTALPEVTSHCLAPGTDEFMILACDGLWDVLSSQRAIELARVRLREHNEPQRVAEELVAEALRLHTTDNVTVIAVCFGDDPPRKRVYGSARFSRSVTPSRDGLAALAALLGEQRP